MKDGNQISLTYPFILIIRRRFDLLKFLFNEFFLWFSWSHLEGELKRGIGKGQLNPSQPTPFLCIPWHKRFTCNSEQRTVFNKDTIKADKLNHLISQKLHTYIHMHNVPTFHWLNFSKKSPISNLSHLSKDQAFFNCLSYSHHTAHKRILRLCNS